MLNPGAVPGQRSTFDEITIKASSGIAIQSKSGNKTQGEGIDTNAGYDLCVRITWSAAEFFPVRIRYKRTPMLVLEQPYPRKPACKSNSASEKPIRVSPKKNRL
jgi:hypothetical protein